MSVSGYQQKRVRMSCLVVVLLLLLPFTVVSQDIESIEGPLCVVKDTVTQKTFTLSPEHSTYNVVVTDGFAHVKLTQLYVNKYGRIRDIIYVFPLPHKGSVHSMSMLYKDELYKAQIMERQEAERKMDSVAVNGGTGALLIQERPNIFQQRLSNIAFGDSAWVTIGFSMPLKYDNNTYELAIPTMIGERYQSEGEDFVPSGPFWNPPEDRDGQSLQINVLIQTGFRIIRLESPTHPMVTNDLATMRQELEQRGVLEPGSEIEEPFHCGGILLTQATYPNRDFVLRFSRQEAKQDFTIASWYDRERNEGYFAMSIFPDTSIHEGARPDLDIVLLVDHSGSQNGWPLEAEKKVCSEILTRLLPTDKLSVLAFESSVTWAFGSELPRDAKPENIGIASTFINSLTATGGTQLLTGVQQALSVPLVSGYERYYVILTDGFVTNETTILTTIRDHPSNPTVFTFGCGNSINRYLIDEAATTGNGGYGTVITEIEALESVVPFVDAAWEKIITPQLKNVTVTFGTVGAANLLMPLGANLTVGRAIEVYGTYATGGQSTVTVKGTVNGQEKTIAKTMTFASRENMNFMVPKIWAREYIDFLSKAEGTTQSNKAAIIEVSIAFQVLSKYTAFLAISPVKKNGTIAVWDDPLRDNRMRHSGKLSIAVLPGSVRITLPCMTHVRELVVFDIKGRVVFTLPFNARLQVQAFTWDGMISTGERLKPGLYVLCLKTAAGVMKSSFVLK
ncbi:MAG: VWA domain-containing protein [Chitinispirillaceae bacterium]|nr:VWA domain-containing protein [Chitinispirillaceae bacterium]